MENPNNPPDHPVLTVHSLDWMCDSSNQVAEHRRVEVSSLGGFGIQRGCGVKDRWALREDLLSPLREVCTIVSQVGWTNTVPVLLVKLMQYTGSYVVCYLLKRLELLHNIMPLLPTANEQGSEPLNSLSVLTMPRRWLMGPSVSLPTGLSTFDNTEPQCSFMQPITKSA